MLILLKVSLHLKIKKCALMLYRLLWGLLHHFVTQMVKLVDLDGLETFIQRDAGGFNIKH